MIWRGQSHEQLPKPNIETFRNTWNRQAFQLDRNRNKGTKHIRKAFVLVGQRLLAVIKWKVSFFLAKGMRSEDWGRVTPLQNTIQVPSVLLLGHPSGGVVLVSLGEAGLSRPCPCTACSHWRTAVFFLGENSDPHLCSHPVGQNCPVVVLSYRGGREMESQRMKETLLCQQTVMRSLPVLTFPQDEPTHKKLGCCFLQALKFKKKKKN